MNTKPMTFWGLPVVVTEYALQPFWPKEAIIIMKDGKVARGTASFINAETNREPKIDK